MVRSSTWVSDFILAAKAQLALCLMSAFQISELVELGRQSATVQPK
jgi:hypothetical protein